MSSVTVPCSACAAPISHRDRACPACGAAVSRETRAGLEARLEAENDDYRDARQAARGASTFLLVLGLLYLGLGGIFFLVERSADVAQPGASLAAPLALVANTALGLFLLAGSAWSRRAPVPGLTASLVAWSSVQVLQIIASPIAFLAQFLSPVAIALLMGKIVILTFLVRGLLAAVRAPSLLEEVETSAGTEQKGA
jgi:hypothetical protein